VRAAPILAALLAAVATAGCGEAAPKATSLADLVVRVDDDGPGGARPPRELRLRCADPRDSTACGAAAGVSEAELRPSPADRICAELYGGPQTASITGRLRRDAVSARYSRANRCEVNRWERVRDLLVEVP
jgi:hypothetical protein